MPIAMSTSPEGAETTFSAPVRALRVTADGSTVATASLDAVRKADSGRCDGPAPHRSGRGTRRAADGFDRGTCHTSYTTPRAAFTAPPTAVRQGGDPPLPE